MTPPGDAWDDDPWAGMVDENGVPLDLPAAETVAAEAVAAGKPIDGMAQAHLPEEFWGARELFKQVWWAAKAEGAMPDAVLGVTLARAAAMVSHELTFNSGKPGNLNLFVNLIAPSGIGKSEAMRSAAQLIELPPYLTDRYGDPDRDRWRESALGSGEGMAEIYMGTKDVETGEIYRSGPDKGQPKTRPIRIMLRNNAFLHLDEGETLTKMLERKGATVGQTMRTAWVGGALGAANARDETTRDIPARSYAMGMVIGFQPLAAQQLLSDGGGGTPQRFLWLSALDQNMAASPSEPPPPHQLALSDERGNPRRGVVAFPQEIKQALWDNLDFKTKNPGEINELNSHEPLMRCKLAALLCVLDNRMEVDREDWRLAGMLWAVSCAVRDRLIEYGRQQKVREREAEKERHAELAAAGETARLEVSERVAAYGRAVGVRVHDPLVAPDGWLGRSDERRRAKSSLRASWDAGLEYAQARGWVALSEDGSKILVGDSAPS